MRLLLVEDHVPLADELLAALGRQGYAVDWLADGRDAVYQGATEPYDLIVLDLGLPCMPGLEVLQQWRGKGLLPRTDSDGTRFVVRAYRRLEVGG